MRIESAIAVAFFLAAVSTSAACTVDGPEPPGGFSCTTDDDCLDGFECVDDRCQERDGPTHQTCVDEDGDGYGANETDADRQDCPKCENPDQICTENMNCCAQDSDDDNGDIHPNAQEPCDGIDNDSDGEVDEPSPCSTTGDCPQPADLLSQCVAPDTGSACDADDEQCECRVTVTDTQGKPSECLDLSCDSDTGTYVVPSQCE